MAKPKKGQLAQFIFPLVDSVDFATIESAVTASQVNAGTRKFYGINHGGSTTTTSGSISKPVSLVRSGVFRVNLKGTENNYDEMMVRIAGVTGCAEQIMLLENTDYYDSDIYSLLSDFQSDFQSRVTAAVATNAQLSDLSSDLKSYLAGMSDVLSKVYAEPSDTHSDLRSLIATTGVNLTASAISDIASAVWAQKYVNHSNVSSFGSLLRDVNTSQLSDIQSYLVAMSDVLSKVYAEASDTHSDLRSLLIAGVGLNASALSDVGSAVWANAIGSDVNSRIGAIVSRVTKEVASKSLLSDVQSD